MNYLDRYGVDEHNVMCHVQQVTLAAQIDAEVNVFRKEVARRMRLPPWNANINSNVNVSRRLFRLVLNLLTVQ